jgi:hypothetical protein
MRRGAAGGIPKQHSHEARSRRKSCPAFPTLALHEPRRSIVELPAIENLIASYAELVDAGDFAGVAKLLADATFTGGAGSVSGRDAIEKMLQESVIVYDDGTPRTKHVTTNVAIEVDEEAGRSVSRS